ncbi:hypothetical protein C8R46DRAFT_1050696 [Mycena filopes]|nr:hypothetical protein C8R46DRAFT_1050696 [Mycena filopes]
MSGTDSEPSDMEGTDSDLSDTEDTQMSDDSTATAHPPTAPPTAPTTDVSLDSDEEDPRDEDFMPSREWVTSFVDQWTLYYFRTRTAPIPTALRDLSPAPKHLTAGHMRALGFKTIHWDEPRAFTDQVDRIGAFFIGPPAQRTDWERTIIQATNEMQEAHAYLLRGADHSLRSGITYNPALGRPCEISNNKDGQYTLALLRQSPSILEITSFQNAMLQTVAPRLWNLGRDTVDRVLANDLRLHLPLRYRYPANPQPTAFAELEFRFVIEDSLPLARDNATGRASGWDVVTSLGHYESSEGQLILWENRSVLVFPPGSTFFMPTGLLTSSFTTISDTSTQMLVVQSLDRDLEYFVENGCQPAPPVFPPRFVSAAERRADLLERAEVLLAKYPTIQEFDASTYYYGR